jgi:Trp operon repressor
MTPEEQAQWDRFVTAARKTVIEGIAPSALTMILSPPDPENLDIKQAFEIGASLLLDKPLVLLVMSGRPVPPGLRRAAHTIIRLQEDLDTEAGRRELKRKLEPVLREVGRRG